MTKYVAAVFVAFVLTAVFVLAQKREQKAHHHKYECPRQKSTGTG